MGMKGFTLFTGGGGVDIAMESLGVEVAGGIEYDDKIATVARSNGFKVTTADILECDPADFPAMDWLHASPPCPNFSVAKAQSSAWFDRLSIAQKISEWVGYRVQNQTTSKGNENTNDLELALKIAEWVKKNLPSIITIENVYAYRKSHSMLLIGLTLEELGYTYEWKHINFADYAVPQTRKRFILIARRDGIAPVFPMPSHQKKADMFSEKWIGWYEAIEDLIPDLPDSKFANWQLKRLPKEFTETLPAAFIAAQGSYEKRLPVYQAGEPHGTITANSNQTGIKAFVMNTDSKAGIRNRNEPSPTIVCREDRPIAFITDRLNSSAVNPNRYADQPSATIVVYSPKHQSPNGYANGRVVKMTVRALARFQTFPDWYKNPTARIIGNAVPPTGFANVMRGIIQ